MMEKIKQLQQWINESKHLVFFGGAGVSTESGLKDFRSEDGLYRIQYDYPPEKILSHSFFEKQPLEFFRFYKDKLNAIEAQPNICHRYLKSLEDRGKSCTIITQNIDGLHTKAGCSQVLELHGSIYRNTCIQCGKKYPASFVFSSKDIPTCSCGGRIKPDVVLYEETLDDKVVNQAIKAIKQADLLIVAGTSLTVYPACTFLHYYQGNHLVLINRDNTPFDNISNLVFHEKIGEVISKLE